MPALEQQLAHVHLGFARLHELRVRFREAFELGGGISQELVTQHQVAGLGSLVDQSAAFLVIQQILQLGGKLRIVSEQLDEVERKVVKAAIPELVQEPHRRSRVFPSRRRRMPAERRGSPGRRER